MGLIKRIILGFLFLFFISSLTKNFFEYRRNLEFYEGYKEEYTLEKRRNNELESQLVKSKDPFVVEKTIRNELNLLKDGEVAVLMPKPSPTPVSVTPTTVPSYRQWINLFQKN
ncbi:MAG: FtsB family cell division protein [Patescibacteria group bacterium]